MKVEAESFYLNGHIIGFRPHIQKLESPYKTPSNTLAVKGLRKQSILYASMKTTWSRYQKHTVQIAWVSKVKTRE